MRWLVSLLMCGLVLVAQPSVAAKRLGGGESVGKQSGQVTQPPSTSGQSAAPTPSAPSSAGDNVAKGASAAQPKAWTGVLGGLAAGLGLAWLASSLGLGEVFASVLLMGLVIGLVMLVAGLVLRSRSTREDPATGNLAFQGAGAGDDRASIGKAYSPQNVGNDASARPWERQSMAFETSRFSQTEQENRALGSSLPGTPSWGVPDGFDVEGFLEASRTNFVSLQAAWDRADIAQLRAMMTDDMLAQIQLQLQERERQSSGVANVTEVVMLEARLLGIEESSQGYIASVEFSGMVREDPSSGPNPFREVWNISRAKTGPAGWLVAGVQALQ